MASELPPPETFADCVHCGLCLTACPTYLELGTEMDSPRGRIYLMRELAEQRMQPEADVLQHLDSCLGCLACETACPSGVRYGALLEDSRAELHASKSRPVRRRWIERIVRFVMPNPALLRFLFAPLVFLDVRGWLSGARARSRWFRLLPELRWSWSRAGLVQPAPAEGGRPVVFLEGCVNQVLSPSTNDATITVLSRHGCEVSIPENSVCCGALAMHTGDREGARRLARRNIEAIGEGDAPILSNAAGCGSALKAYGQWLADDERYAARAQRFAERVQDISEFLAAEPLEPGKLLRPLRVAYHDACHLAHAQGIREEPRAVLAAIGNLELIPLEESEVCCGSAGSYNLVEGELSAALGRRKAERIRASGADVVAVGNPGCAMQIRAALVEAGVDAEVVHPVELVERARRVTTMGKLHG